MAKYKGSALVVRWHSGGGTTNLTGDSRVMQVNEQANQIDVTTRSDSARAYLADFPEITADLTSLDTTGTTQAWDSLNIGDTGTIEYSPEGTASNMRKRMLPATLLTKNFNSPYDGAVETMLEWSSNGGTVTKSLWS